MDRDEFLSREEREHDIIDDSNMDEREKYEAHLELEREARREYFDRYADRDCEYEY